MERPIDVARSWLASHYKKLNLAIEEHPVQYQSACPAFFSVSEDLEPVIKPADNGLLLDPEIGIVVFLLDFTKKVDISSQIAKGLKYRSRLLRDQISQEGADTQGSWRIILHWFVQDKDRVGWCEQAAGIRYSTPHLEEIAIDGIFCDIGQSWQEALNRHGMPRLLFQTRTVLNMQSGTQVLKWQSPDERVQKSLTGFTDTFHAPLEKKYASKVEHLIQHQEQETIPADFPETPLSISQLGIKNFRNFDEIEMYFSGDIQQGAVIHGPNGAGKSNLVEALEFALTGFSKRAEKFIQDKDIKSSKKTNEYIRSYLSPIHNASKKPSIELNGKPSHILPENLTEPRDALHRLEDTILTQEISARFAEKSSDALAADILGDFSNLAHRVTKFAEQEQEKARSGQRSLLLNLDISKSITKPETAFQRIATIKIRDTVILPPSILSWLADPSLLFSPKTSGATQFVHNIKSFTDSVDDMSQSIINLNNKETIARTLYDFLYNAWSEQTIIAKFIEYAAEAEKNFSDTMIQDLELWHRWLMANKKETIDKQPTQNLSALEKEKTTLEKQLSEITRKGQLYSEREKHYEQLVSFLSEQWCKKYPDICPTCDSDLRERGGALQVINEVRAANRKELDLVRQQYKDVQAQLHAVLQKQGATPQSKCPVDQQMQNKIKEILVPWLPEDVELDNILNNEQLFQELQNWIRCMQQSPGVPMLIAEEERENHALLLAGEITKSFKEIEETFAAPSAWKQVVNKLKKQLAKVLDDHLPDTLGKLWKELVLNLTPAPWQMPGELLMHIENRYGKNRATLNLATENKDLLARYILNSAEKNALGLAWFLTRYLSVGRFRYSLLALDDPAHEMDQTTYRDLCRLLETLLRLHRVKELPLLMLILIHQDGRALDMARATDALLYRIQWNRGKTDFKEKRYLYSPEHLHPLPDFLFTEEVVVSD